MQSELKSRERGYKWFIRALASKETMITLLIALCVFLAVTTFTENVFIRNIVRILLGLTASNLVLCTWQRIKSLPAPVLFMHIGVIITLIGGAASFFRLVATVNIYEGAVTDMVYRWDLQKDASIGTGIMIKKLHEEYYPAAVKVGVLKNREKYGLFTLKTGEEFNLDNYRIHAASLDFQSETLRLGIFYKGEYIGYSDTSGIMKVKDEFPYEFKLVAYKNPVIKKTWVDLQLLKNDRIVAEGTAGVNSPLTWNGMNFYHTATNRDGRGNIFVGLQITRDPGLPYVYIGFAVTTFGGVFYLLRRLRWIR